MDANYEAWRDEYYCPWFGDAAADEWLLEIDEWLELELQDRYANATR